MANALAPKAFSVSASFLGQEDRPQRYVLPVCRLPFQSNLHSFPETKPSTAGTILRNGQKFVISAILSYDMTKAATDLDLTASVHCWHNSP